MGFFEAVKTCFRKYADFSGRARRREYWFFKIFNTILISSLVLIWIVCCLDISSSIKNPIKDEFYGVGIVAIIIAAIYFIAILIPSFAVVWRRLHDIGKSGLFYFLIFVPYIGGLILFVLTLMDSTPGDNEFGPNPKEVFIDDEF